MAAQNSCSQSEIVGTNTEDHVDVDDELLSSSH